MAMEPGSAGDAETLTLERCIKIAVESATSIQKLKNGSEISGLQVLQDYAQFLPDLTFTGNYSAQTGRYLAYTQTIGRVNTFDQGGTFQLSSSVNLFNGLGDTSALNAAIERKSASLFTLKRAKQQIALDVAQSYLQAIYDRRLVAIAKENLEASKERQKLLSEQVRLGAKDHADLYRQEALTSQAESFLTSASNRQKNDEINLLKRLRLDVRKTYLLQEPALQTGNDDPGGEQELIQRALENRPDMKAMNELSQAARLDVKVAHAGSLPKLDFGAAISDGGRIFQTHRVNGTDVIPAQQDPLFEQFGNQITYMVGVTLTWNIFDRDLVKVAEQKASILARNTMLDADDMRNAIVAEARQAFGDYISAKSQYEAAERGLTAAQKAFEVINGRYGVGSAKFVDVADAQAGLILAESTKVQAIFALELQRRALHTVAGSFFVP
jgi:outer membrane protein